MQRRTIALAWVWMALAGVGLAATVWWHYWQLTAPQSGGHDPLADVLAGSLPPISAVWWASVAVSAWGLLTRKPWGRITLAGQAVVMLLLGLLWGLSVAARGDLRVARMAVLGTVTCVLVPLYTLFALSQDSPKG